MIVKCIWIIIIFFLLKVNGLNRSPENRRVYRKNKDLKICEGSKYMEKLKEYDLKAQEFIITLGSFIYDKSHEYFETEFTEETVLEKWNSEIETQKLMKDKKNIEERVKEKEKEIRDLRERIYSVREEEREKVKREEKDHLEYYKKQLEDLKAKEMIMIKERKVQIEEALETSEKNLKERIEILEKKCKEYNEMYVEASKGKKYECELLPMLEEYNDKQLDSNWEIIHVGNIAMKTDFLFKNKLNGNTILLDTKNNNPESGVQKVALDKFKRDVKRKENDAIGGILLANAYIHTKKNYEINRESDKVLIYIGCFNRENISLIFNSLEIIMELNKYKSKEEMISSDNLKDLYKDQYSYEVSKKNQLEKEIKVLDDRIMYIINEYRNVFGEDIELDIDNDIGKKRDKILDYDSLEKDKKVIGERSKNYDCYNINNEEIIEYYKTKRELTKGIKEREIKPKKVVKRKKKEENMEIEIATLEVNKN